MQASKPRLSGPGQGAGIATALPFRPPWADARSDGARAIARAAAHTAAYALALAGSVAWFFHRQIGSGFAVLLSDRYDGFIEIALLEHWYNVLRGDAPWATTFYFHPYHRTLSYNDGYLLYGLPYAALRALGADPFLGSALVNVLLRVVGFIAFHLFLRRGLRLCRVAVNVEKSARSRV